MYAEEHTQTLPQMDHLGYCDTYLVARGEK